MRILFYYRYCGSEAVCFQHGEIYRNSSAFGMQQMKAFVSTQVLNILAARSAHCFGMTITNNLEESSTPPKNNRLGNAAGTAVKYKCFCCYISGKMAARRRREAFLLFIKAE